MNVVPLPLWIGDIAWLQNEAQPETYMYNATTLVYRERDYDGWSGGNNNYFKLPLTSIP